MIHWCVKEIQLHCCCKSEQISVAFFFKILTSDGNCHHLPPISHIIVHLILLLLGTFELQIVFIFVLLTGELIFQNENAFRVQKGWFLVHIKVSENQAQRPDPRELTNTPSVRCWQMHMMPLSSVNMSLSSLFWKKKQRNNQTTHFSVETLWTPYLARGPSCQRGLTTDKCPRSISLGVQEGRFATPVSPSSCWRVHNLSTPR